MTFCRGFGVKLFSDPVSDPDRGNVPVREKGDGNNFTPISCVVYLFYKVLFIMGLLLFQIFVFIAYVSFVVSSYGVLPSISDSWYSLPIGRKGLFTFFTWGIGIPMLLYGTLPMFVSGIGLCFVGAATQFKMKESYTRLIHFAGASVGIVTPLLYFYLSYNNPLPFAIQVGSTIIIMGTEGIKNKLWWIEIVGFLMVVYGIYSVLPEMYYVGV